MLTITHTINHERAFLVRFCREFYLRAMIFFCKAMHREYRIRQRVKN